jgi:hypothetical protein
VTQTDNQPPHDDARSDDQVVIRASDPVVMESLVNTEGRRQAVEKGRNLVGIQVGGSGQGSQFSCLLLFSRDVSGGNAGDGLNFAQVDSGPTGVECFFFKGETEEELTIQMDAAIARAEAFGAGTSGMEWRGMEISGGSFGGEHMGVLVAWRNTLE